MTLTEKVLRAERFELVDHTGKLRAVLGAVVQNGYGLTFCDPTGQPRASLGFTPEGKAALHLTGPQATIVALEVEGDGGAKVAITKGGRRCLGLGVLPDGMPALSFFDAEEVIRAAVMLNPEDGQPGLILRPTKGEGKSYRAPEQPPRKAKQQRKAVRAKA